MLAGPPLGEVDVPETVIKIARGRELRVVWLNELGGLTVEIGRGSDRCFLKWAPVDSGLDLAGEAARLTWVEPFTLAPRVLEVDAKETGSWLVTAALPGETAVSERWQHQPAAAVRALGEGLRHLHDNAPVPDCPFSWSMESRLQVAHQRIDEGTTDPARWHPDHQTLSIEAARSTLDERPPTDQLVVCHGDACAPNTLLTDDGRWSGQVDFGALGVADRWADLAVATWSTEWNYGPGWEQPLLDAYGIEADPDRTRYYRLLWDLT